MQNAQRRQNIRSHRMLQKILKKSVLSNSRMELKCRVGFSQQNERKSHEDKCNRRVQKCYICGKFFWLRKMHLGKHVRIHSCERPHQCQHCLWRFSRESNLSSLYIPENTYQNASIQIFDLSPIAKHSRKNSVGAAMNFICARSSSPEMRQFRKCYAKAFKRDAKMNANWVKLNWTHSVCGIKWHDVPSILLWHDFHMNLHCKKEENRNIKLYMHTQVTGQVALWKKKKQFQSM